jgi:ATP-dependent protease HslVU (ClpYQ) peptidase subunit
VTCLVGLVDKGQVWIGADSSAIGSVMGRRSPADAKIAQVGPLLIAAAGNHRAWQVIRHGLEVPAHEAEHGDALNYMVSVVADALRSCFERHGVGASGGEGDESPASLMIGYQGRLFSIYSDYQVAEFAEDYHALGAGEAIALGALYAAPKGWGPRKRLEVALEAAEAFGFEVRRPFIVMRAER